MIRELLCVLSSSRERVLRVLTFTGPILTELLLFKNLLIRALGAQQEKPSRPPANGGSLIGVSGCGERN